MDEEQKNNQLNALNGLIGELVENSFASKDVHEWINSFSDKEFINLNFILSGIVSSRQPAQVANYWRGVLNAMALGKDCFPWNHDILSMNSVETFLDGLNEND